MVGDDDPCWAEIRRHYLGAELRVPELCERFGITAAQLTQRRRAENWPKRRGGRPPGRRTGKRVERGADQSSPMRVQGAEAAPPSESGAGVGGRQALIDRLYKAIDRKLRIIEERMANGEEQSPADTERDSRSIGALIRNLEKLTAFDGQSRGGGEKRGGIAGVSADEADRIRRDLAARIEKMGSQGNA